MLCNVKAVSILWEKLRKVNLQKTNASFVKDHTGNIVTERQSELKSSLTTSSSDRDMK